MGDIVNRLNKDFYGIFKIYGHLKHLPVLRDVGFVDLEEPYSSEAERFSKKLKFNEFQAVLSKPLTDCWQDHIWEYKKALYSYIATLRNHQKQVEVITANVLVFTTINNVKYLILQKRSANSGLYPGYYSIFGGAFSPKDDDGSLCKTAMREIYEEIDGVLTPKEQVLKQVQNSQCLLTQEVDNGNFQINFLGIELELSGDAKGSIDEGDLIKVDMRKLGNFLQENKNTITPLALSCLMVFKDQER